MDATAAAGSQIAVVAELEVDHKPALAEVVGTAVGHGVQRCTVEQERELVDKAVVWVGPGHKLAVVGILAGAPVAQEVLEQTQTDSVVAVAVVLQDTTEEGTPLEPLRL